MDEAQKELEKNALPGQKADDEDDEDDDGGAARTGRARVDTDGRSVRSSDRDLLEGADAEAADGNGNGRRAAGEEGGGNSPAGVASANAKIVGVEFEG